MYGHRLIRELLGLLFLFCGLLMLLSLWSYDISDPTFNLAVSRAKLPAVHNAAGLFGAYLSGFLVDSCGLGAFLWIIFFLAVGAGFVSRWIVIKWYRWIGYLLLFACTVTFASALDISWHGIRGGGLLGTYLSASSYVFFSPVGSVLVWGFIFLIAMELSFSISWLAIILALAAAVSKLIPDMGDEGLPRPDFSEKLNRLRNLRIPRPRRPQKDEEPAAPEFDIIREAQGLPAQDEAAGDASLQGGTDQEEQLQIAPASEPWESASADAAASADSGPAFLINAPFDEPDALTAPRGTALDDLPDAGDSRTSSGPLLLDLDGAAPQAAPLSEPAPEKDGLELLPDDDDAAAPADAPAGFPQNAPVQGGAIHPEQPQSAPASEPRETASGNAAASADSALSFHDASDAQAAPPASGSPADILPGAGELRTASLLLDLDGAAPQAEPVSEPAPEKDGFDLQLNGDDAPAHVGAPAGNSEDRPAALILDEPESAAAVGFTEAAEAPGRSTAQTPAPRTADDTPLPEDEIDAEDRENLDRQVSDALARQEELDTPSAAPATPLQPEPAPRPVLKPRRQYAMPTTELLDAIPETAALSRPDRAMLLQQGEAVITCLRNFNVNADLARITPGPVVTMFEVRPAPGVKATRITNLANDLAMSLKALAVRMQAPVPGTDTVGIEVPNDKRQTVFFREIIEHSSFTEARSLLSIALGKDISGVPVSADLAKMPHLLVAGATGKGKSVCLNSILISLLFRARPDEMKLILVDPKRVEFSMYADLPHLVHPVVTDMDFTKNALLWAVDEMMRRLDVFSDAMVRNITGYNDRIRELRAQVEAGGPIPRDKDGRELDLEPMPFLVIVIDELADLMQMKRKEVEGPIIRLAQMGRAAGLHLIIATQRPSVDVVTGLIKANFPCRIAFQVTNGQDSRTILDTVGAEKLLGMGDMLFKPNGDNIRRLHGAFVSDHDVAEVVGFWKRQQKPDYQVDFSKYGDEEEDAAPESLDASHARGGDIADDPLYAEATQFVYETGKVSISLLQRRFRIGFNRAARFYEQMEKDGIVGQSDGGGAKPRSVIHR